MDSNEIITIYDFIAEHLKKIVWNDPYTLKTIIVSVAFLIILAIVFEVFQSDSRSFKKNKIIFIVLMSIVIDFTILIVFECNMFAAIMGVLLGYLISNVLYVWFYDKFEKFFLRNKVNRKTKKIKNYIDYIYENKDEIIDQYNEHPEIVQSLPIVTVLNLYGYTTLNQNERARMENNHTIDNAEAFLETMRHLPCITSREAEEITIIFNTIRSNGKLIKRDEMDSILAQYHDKKAAEIEYNNSHNIKDTHID